MNITLEVPRPRHCGGKAPGCPGPLVRRVGRLWRRAGGKSTGAIAGDAFGPAAQRGAA